MDRLAMQTKRRHFIPAGSDGGRARGARARRQRARVMLEALEDRRLLSTLDISAGALTYDADNTGAASSLTISVDPSDKSNAIFADAGQAITLGGGALGAGWTYDNIGHTEVSGPIGSYSSSIMTVTGSTTQGDSLTLDYSNGDPLPSMQMNFTPASATGSAANTVTLTPGTGSEKFLNGGAAPLDFGSARIGYSDSPGTMTVIQFSNVSLTTDLVPAPFYIFDTRLSGATTVNVVDGPSGTTQVNDGGTGAFEPFDFANKAEDFVYSEAVGATTTVDTTTTAGDLTTLYVFSDVGDDTVDFQATPGGVTSIVDTGSPSGSEINVGSNGLLTSIHGPILAQSTGGANALAIDDSNETTAQTYTIDNGVITATSLPSTITLNSSGLTTLDLDSAGGSTVNLDALTQVGVSTYNFGGGSGLGPNTLNVTSDVMPLDYSTAGSLTFGTGEPTINYSNTQTINVTKPAIPPVGTSATITGTTGTALNNVVVATFTDPDPANTVSGYVASIDWGDGTTSAGTITPVGTQSYEITGSHTYAASGSYTVDVTLTDLGTTGSVMLGSGGNAAAIHVASYGPVSSTPNPIASTANISPVLLPNSVYDFNGLTLAGVVQDVQTTQDVASFKSTDAIAVASDFTATIDWGDQPPSTAGTITEDASGVFHVSGTHIYTTARSFTPMVTVKDINGTVFATGGYYQTNLVSSGFGVASELDSNLINPWGMTAGEAGLWVADEGSGLATVYNPNASPITQSSNVITVASGEPTGIVSNVDTNGFSQAQFLYATLGGHIDAYVVNQVTSPEVTVVGATFTGLAQAAVTSGTTTTYYLYAADFSGTTGADGIDVFDPTFANVSSTTFAGKFADPLADVGFFPYNIVANGGVLYVSYARPNGTTAEAGYIDEFDTSGNFLRRVYNGVGSDGLSGPWGMAIAPLGFGVFGGDLLVGNFGDASGNSPNGTIYAIVPGTGQLFGTIDAADGSPIVNPGIRSLLFGTGGTDGTSGTLYISAGIDGQTQGLFAAISAAASPSVTVAAAPPVPVVAAPLTAMGATLMGIEGNALSTSATGVLVATFMDTGIPGAPSSYTATIDWGDGTTSAGTITSEGTVYSVLGDHTYYGVGTYPVTVTISSTASGATAVASSQAVITPMLIADTPPTVDYPERFIFSGPVAEFTDPNPTGTASQFAALIDWGDGSPASAGTVTLVSSTATSTTFLVSGTHTYADLFGTPTAISNDQTSSTFPLLIHVVGTDGSSINLTNTATVFGRPFTLSGQLDPASDSGISNSDDITNVTRPTFEGSVSEPFARIYVYANPQGNQSGAAGPLLGSTTADSTGAWSLTSGISLPDGAYTIVADAIDATNSNIARAATAVFDLRIETVGPKVTGMSFDPSHGRIVVTFQDFGGANNFGSGMDLASLIDAANYQFTTVHHPRIGKFVVNVISDVPGTTPGTQTVTLSINGGKSIKGKWYFFTIFTASPSNPSGVQDIAGNALDGEFYGYFPSGNNIPGGNFVTQLTAMHHTVFAPTTVIGRATPVKPPGTRQGKVTEPGTDDPSKRHGSSSLGSARSRAPQKGTKVVHHSDPSLRHPIHRVGSRPIATSSSASSQATAMGALGSLDQALDQLGGAKHPKS